MLHRIPRSVRWALMVAVLGAITVAVLQSWVAAAPGTFGWTQTQWGPVGPADRDLLVKVRQAGLWEMPTGQQAQQQAVNPQVKQAGAHIASEHTQLDDEVRRVADQLGVALPTRPTDQQIGWMNQISAATGADYDRKFVQFLRQAHGTVLPIIAEVRATTRNELVRQFATTANEFVSRHIGYLEATGLVDYNALPEPASPGLLGGGTSLSDMIVPAIVFLAAAGAAVGLLMTLRRGRKTRSSRRDAGGPATGPQLAALHGAPPTQAPPTTPRRRAGRRALADGAALPPAPAESSGQAYGSRYRGHVVDGYPSGAGAEPTGGPEAQYAEPAMGGEAAYAEPAVDPRTHYAGPRFPSDAQHVASETQYVEPAVGADAYYAEPAGGAGRSARYSTVSRTGRNKAHNPQRKYGTGPAGSSAGRPAHRSSTREMTR